MKRPNYTSFLFKSLGVILMLAVIFTACKKDDEPVPKQTADFATTATTVSEDAGAASTVTINFDKATTSDSELTVSLTNAAGVEYTTHYVTNPNGSSGSFVLSVAKGANSASFTVTPVDDTEENDARVITMEITGATGSLELGTSTTHTFTITDNDVPASVNFAAASSTVAEGAGTAHTIELNLTSATVNAGTFDVTITSTDATYTTDYTTDPDGSSGTMTISVAQGATAASFTVTPVDNAVEGADKVITFTIANPTGGVNLGQATSHELTITDDDDALAKTIAELRALYDGSADVNITENWTIQGTVVSTNDATTSRSMFIQDATAGIVIRWDETHSFSQGDNMTINLQGSVITNFNALVQIGDDGLMPLSNGTVNSQGNTITPVTVTFAQLNTGDYEGQLVKVDNVSFADADGIATVESNNTGNDGVTDGVMRVEFYAPFADNLLPRGTGSIIGAAGTFQGTAQVLPQLATDIFQDVPPATNITVTATLTEFTDVQTGANSASQSYTVTGNELSTDIIVTAPNQFEVSLDDAAFSPTVSVPFAQANAGEVTVYVRYSPTTGYAVSPSSLIKHESTGAITQTLEVSGTELPSATTNVLFTDDFDYGSVSDDLTYISSIWNAHSGAGNNPAGYATTSLSMTGYGSSGVGGSMTIADPGGSSEDINATYTEQTTGSIYASALVDINSFTSTGNDYFMHFKDAGFGFYARVYAQDVGGKLRFGLREGSSGTASIVYSDTDFEYSTTYLLVLKYDFTAGAASIYVLDNAAVTEPGTPTVTIDDADNATSLSSIGVRQGSNTPNATIDGVRVATDWAGIIGN